MTIMRTAGEVKAFLATPLGREVEARAAAKRSSLKSRLVAYGKPYGTGRNHYGGHMIYPRRAVIVMEYAVLDLPAFEINQLAEDLIEKHNPPWNMNTDRFRG